MLFVALLVYVLQRCKVVLPMFINNYLNDILSIPLTLCIILATVRLWKGSVYRLSNLHIGSIVVYFSLYFEVYLPQHNFRYTADIFDLLCYVIGAVIFYLLQEKELI